MKLGIIGTSTAGKTYLVTAINRLVLGGKLRLTDSLEITVVDGIDTTKRLQETKDVIDIMQQQALGSSVVGKDFDFRLVHGGIDDVVAITYHDHVGQALTDADSSKDQSRSELISNVSKSDVIWFLLPLQVDNVGKYAGVKMDDLVLAQAYLRDCLRERVNSGIASPLAFAIVVTKADILGTAEFFKEKQEIIDLCDDLKSRFEGLIGSQHISVAAFFPVSVLGFDNAEFVSENNETTFLLASNDLQPYNVDRLLLWSLLAAAYQKEGQVDDKVRRSILKNLTGLSGFMYSFKD